MSASSPSPGPAALAQALRSVRLAFVGALVLGAAVNVLMLTGPLFMLQVYDRVLASRSVPTLAVLFALTVGLFAFMGLFDLLRQRVMSRVGHALERKLGNPTFQIWILQGLSPRGASARPLADLAAVRGALSSPGFIALFDLPFVPLFVGVVFLFHLDLGLLTCAGIAVAVGLAVIGEATTRNAFAQAAVAEIKASRFAEQSLRHAESILAMGMLGRVRDHWRAAAGAGGAVAQAGSERTEAIGAFSKAWRLLMQSAILGLGAYLAIYQEITPGMIIAASIIAGRALAPIDQVVGQWRMLVKARAAYRRLGEHLGRAETAEPRLELPAPRGQVSVRGLRKLAPDSEKGQKRVILEGVSFDLKPGDGLGIIGPSTAGKSTLARLLVGVWQPDAGSVRLDGAPFDQWDPDVIGRHIRYLPQHVELLPGTIAENIARFDPNASNADIVEAAKLAGVHRLILGLPEGYATRIGYGPSLLSGGQVQRIALARAVYGKPALVVLDEPNANLDADGDAALRDAILALRKQETTVVVIAHRPSAIAAVDTILMLNGGRQSDFGPKSEVLARVARVVEA